MQSACMPDAVLEVRSTIEVLRVSTRAASSMTWAGKAKRRESCALKEDSCEGSVKAPVTVR